MEDTKPSAEMKKVDQMEHTKPSKDNEIDDVANDSVLEYAASYLKTGIVRGVTYQMKILTWVAWKLMYKNDAINKWWLATEVLNARGFHDLVLKYVSNTSNGSTSNGKYMYRFVQIKHKTRLHHGTNISANNLISKKMEDRQYSLIYLFKSYLNMIDTFEGITSDQIMDLTVFTNRDINAFQFLVPMDEDSLFDFEGRTIGKRYRVNLEAFQIDRVLMMCMRQIKHPKLNVYVSDTLILNFLRKLVFAVGQPSECELEKLIVKEMGKFCKVPQILYNDLYKNIVEWFLVYDNGKAPYLTEKHVTQYLKKMQDMLLDAKMTETLFINDPVLKLSDKLKLLSL